jgi:hypothetical protein
VEDEHKYTWLWIVICVVRGLCVCILPRSSAFSRGCAVCPVFAMPRKLRAVARVIRPSGPPRRVNPADGRVHHLMAEHLLAVGGQSPEARARLTLSLLYAAPADGGPKHVLERAKDLYLMGDMQVLGGVLVGVFA